MKQKVEIDSGRMGNTGGLHITIVDDASRETLVRVALTPEQAWAVMGGTVLRIEANVSPNLDRVGKPMVTQTVTYPSPSFTDGLSDEEEMGVAVDRARSEHPDWQEYRPRRRNNRDIDVVMYRWQ